MDALSSAKAPLPASVLRTLAGESSRRSSGTDRMTGSVIWFSGRWSRGGGMWMETCGHARSHVDGGERRGRSPGRPGLSDGRRRARSLEAVPAGPDGRAASRCSGSRRSRVRRCRPGVAPLRQTGLDRPVPRPSARHRSRRCGSGKGVGWRGEAGAGPPGPMRSALQRGQAHGVRRRTRR